MRAAVVLAALLLTAPSAAACPFCDGPRADGVNPARSEVLGPGFWPNAAAVAAPFAALLGAAALVRYAPPRRAAR